MYLNIQVKQLSCLHHYHVEDVFTEFANYANEDGLLDRQTFTKCVSQLILATDTLGQREEALSLSLIDGIFDIFDTDGNGVVDFQELACGLSVLCDGSRDDKAKAAFSLFDYNGDGYISFFFLYYTLIIITCQVFNYIM